MDLDAAEPQTQPAGGLGKAISSMMVRLISEYTGRGPKNARTYIQNDMITVVLRDLLTKGERRLADSGRADHVRQTRRLYQEAMRDEIVAGIHELTGRRVIAFLSDNHIDPDMAVQTINLAPDGGDGASPG